MDLRDVHIHFQWEEEWMDLDHSRIRGTGNIGEEQEENGDGEKGEEGKWKWRMKDERTQMWTRKRREEGRETRREERWMEMRKKLVDTW
jgi:hypothetical protein